MNLRKKLEQEWVEELKKLKELEPSSESYRNQTQRVEVIEQRLVELSANKSEDISRYVGHGISVLKLMATAGAVLVTMKWEKLDTLTSTAGKINLRDLVSFKL